MLMLDTPDLIALHLGAFGRSRGADALEAQSRSIDAK
jgi:hypothetical protein